MARAAARERVSPASAAEAAALLRDGPPVRVRGGGTKLSWGRLAAAQAELSTGRLDRLVAHNAGDLTAVLQAGVPLARAQAVFASAGQMLALDPPGEGATIGGVVATGDSGPLRHRYGGPRDLVLGVQAALPDGTVARAGSQVIKNVAGYDLAKLMCGAFGTLGVVTEATVRLHPLPARWCTAVGRSADPAAIARAAAALARLPLEADALDVRWEPAPAEAGSGTPAGGAALARFSGGAAAERAAAALEPLREAGLDAAVAADDDALWAAQRAGQRGGAVVRVSAAPAQLPALLAAAADERARLVARAALGLAWLTLPAAGLAAHAAAVGRLRAALAPAPCVLLDAPDELRAAVDPWGPLDAPRLALARRVKERFDPGGRCNPGLFVGGI